jgi:hypothetical protein
LCSNNNIILEPILNPAPGKVNTNNEEEKASTGPEAIEVEVEGSYDEDYEEFEEEEGLKTPSPKKQKAALRTTTPRRMVKKAPTKKAVPSKILIKHSMVPISKGFLKWLVPD